jgi:hypothetical protein
LARSSWNAVERHGFAVGRQPGLLSKRATMTNMDHEIRTGGEVTRGEILSGEVR